MSISADHWPVIAAIAVGLAIAFARRMSGRPGTSSDGGGFFTDDGCDGDGGDGGDCG